MDCREKSELIFSGPKTPDRGYTVQATTLKDSDHRKGDALIEIFKDGQPVRSFVWPAYKVWNIAAHFTEIVDGETGKHDGGYRKAGWDGITNPGAAQPL